MGHRHWGARVNYGDCLFFTISPNEKHSALVLRLSRYRPNDPCVSEAAPIWKKLCGMHYPCLAARRCKKHCQVAASSSAEDVHDAETPEDGGEDCVDIDLPEYDIRQTAAAQDPLAVVEAHRLNVCLRLAYLFGLRMCPRCPRCNNEFWGCQDLFGSNMRPTGGTLGVLWCQTHIDILTP